MNRREYIKYVGSLVVGAAIGGGATYYLAKSPEMAPQNVTVTQTIEKTVKPPSLGELVPGQFKGQTIRVLSWGGIEAEVYKKYGVQPFVDLTGAEVIYEEHSGTMSGLAKVRAQKDNPQEDIVGLDFGATYTAQAEGLLDPVDGSTVPNLAFLDTPFLATGVVPLTTQATDLLWNTNVFKEPPATWGEIFNPQWKGKVGLSPLTWTGGCVDLILAALDAGGDQYNIEPGFKQLEKLKGGIKIYGENMAMVAELFKSGDLVVASNCPQLFKEYIQDPAYPIGVGSKDRSPQTYWPETWGKVHGHPGNSDAIDALLNFACRPEAQIGYATDLWYGPTNRSVKLPADILPKYPGILVDTDEERLKATKIDWPHFFANQANWTERRTKMGT